MPSKLSRAAAGLISFTLIAALLVVFAVWVERTRLQHVPQLPPPEVSLTAEEIALAGRIPNYRGAIPVLTYHEVSDVNPGEYTVSTRLFASHLAALKKAGFTSITIAELENFLGGRPMTLPDRPIVISFDDGAANNWARVDPILEAYGFNAVAFLITDSVVPSGTPSYYLNEGQLQSLASTGRWEFGGHTHALHSYAAVPEGGTSPMLAHRLLLPDGGAETHEQWAQRVDDDLAASQRFFEEKLGYKTTIFAYPFSAYGRGSNDPAIQADLPRLLVKNGYRTAFIGEQVEPPLAVHPDQAPLLLPRLGVHSSTSVSELLARVQQAIPVPMPLDLASLDWSGQDAKCEAIRQAVPMAVRVSPTAVYTTCRSDANAARWLDYRFTADVWGASRKTTAIVAVRSAHKLDTSGRLEVALGEASAQVRQVVGQKVETLGTIEFTPRSQAGPSPFRRLEIAVRGSTAVVRIDDQPPITVTLDPAISAGGVSLSVASTPLDPVLFAAPQLRPIEPSDPL